MGWGISDSTLWRMYQALAEDNIIAIAVETFKSLARQSTVGRSQYPHQDFRLSILWERPQRLQQRRQDNFHNAGLFLMIPT